MIFQCKVRPCAVPIVRISTHDDQGKPLPKPKNHTKVVKFGQTVGWVDRCSRKHFIPLDAEAKALNEKDYKEMVAELESLNVPIPDNAPFDLLADSLAAIKAKETKTAAIKKQPLLEPDLTDEPTNAELRAQIKAKGGKCHPNDNKAKLKEILSEL